jgi:hypothetical protein
MGAVGAAVEQKGMGVNISVDKNTDVLCREHQPQSFLGDF